MHILYLHHGYFPLLAGAEAMTYQVAERMQQRGHRVQIVCQSPDDRVTRLERGELSVIGVPTLDEPLLRGCLGETPDLVHVVDAVWPEYPVAGAALARAWNVPLAITPASTISTWQDVPTTLAACRAAEIVCVLTEAEREVFAAHEVERERLVVIGQGAQLVGRPDPVTFREAHSISGPMVLFLGRKARFKGYRLLLAATAEVWRTHPAARFVFVGPRWDDDCAAVFAEYADPRIIEIGLVSEQEKHSALAAADLVCLPSSADVFPLVFVEAWTCGKPVIATPFAGVDEIIRHEQDGLIIAPQPDALADAITRLLSDHDTAATMGASGAARVEQQFNWEIVTDRIEAAYRRFTPSHSRSRGAAL